MHAYINEDPSPLAFHSQKQNGKQTTAGEKMERRKGLFGEMQSDFDDNEIYVCDGNTHDRKVDGVFDVGDLEGCME